MLPSVSTWSAHEALLNGTLSMEDFLDRIKDNGARGIEIVDFDLLDASLPALEQIKREVGCRGMTITCMSLEHNLCLPTQEERDGDVARVMRWMEAAKRLDVRNVRVFTGWALSWMPYPIQMEWVYQGLCKLANHAETLDVDLVLENHNSVCLGSGEILDMFKRVGSSRLFTCPDVFNYKTFAGENIPVIDDWSFSEVKPLLRLARNAHIKVCEAVQNDTEDRYLDVGRMVRMLREAEYDGSLALEFMWPYLPAGRDPIVEMLKAVRVVAHHCERSRRF